eukprot:scaffold1127_cov160-Amphora_coffeaeformis.AAC.7
MIRVFNGSFEAGLWICIHWMNLDMGFSISESEETKSSGGLETTVIPSFDWFKSEMVDKTND